MYEVEFDIYNFTALAEEWEFLVDLVVEGCSDLLLNKWKNRYSDKVVEILCEFNSVSLVLQSIAKPMIYVWRISETNTEIVFRVFKMS